MTQKRQYVIIIGAMKSGTTTLFDVLAAHPQIAPASNKEPGFFAFEEVWAQGFEWFDTLFDFDPARHRYRLEASTDYTKAPFVTGVWERMKSRPDVDVRLLYIMRDPLRRIESHARHTQIARKEIGQQISLKTDHSLDAGLSLLNLATSHYALQLDAYQQAWAEGKLHCLTLEELKKNPQETLSAVWRFLELDVPDDSGLPQSNVAGPRTEVHASWQALARMRGLMAAGKILLPASVRQKIRGAFQKEVQAQGRFNLNAAETALLSAILQADADRLKSVYNVPGCDVWSRDASPDRPVAPRSSSSEH